MSWGLSGILGTRLLYLSPFSCFFSLGQAVLRRIVVSYDATPFSYSKSGPPAPWTTRRIHSTASPQNDAASGFFGFFFLFPQQYVGIVKKAEFTVPQSCILSLPCPCLCCLVDLSDLSLTYITPPYASVQ